MGTTIEATTGLRKIVTILGYDIVGDIFEFLDIDTIMTLVDLADTVNDIVLYRNLVGTYWNWNRRRLAELAKSRVLQNLERCHHRAFAVFTKSTYVDSIFEYLSGGDIFNLKQTDILATYNKNEFIQQASKLSNIIEFGLQKGDEYLGVNSKESI